MSGELEINKRIGKYLRQKRVAAGMSQGELAHAVGVTYQQVNKREQGVNRTSLPAFILTCQAIGICPESAIRKIMHESELEHADVGREALDDARSIMSMSPAIRRALVRIGRIIEETSNA